MTKVVRITWVDSCSTRGWQHLEAVSPDPSGCESVGFLVRQTKHAMTVAQSKGSPGSTPFADFITIPRGCIRSVETLSK